MFEDGRVTMGKFSRFRWNVAAILVTAAFLLVTRVEAAIVSANSFQCGGPPITRQYDLVFSNSGAVAWSVFNNYALGLAATNSSSWGRCYLLEVDSSSENSCTFGATSGYGVSPSYVIGANDLQEEQNWQWSKNAGGAGPQFATGERFAVQLVPPFQYMNWNNGEPTNGPGDPENCVEASAAHSGWNDYVCTDGRVHAIVECEVRQPVAGPCVDDLNCEIGIECGEGGVCGGPGAACADPSDCAPSYGCSLTDSECGGVDADCAINDSGRCRSDLVCNEYLSDTCQSPSAVSGACGESDDCAGSVECGTDNVCGGTNAACTLNNDSLCDPLLVCNSNTGTCLPPQVTSGPCDENADCTAGVECGTNNVCGGTDAACPGNNDNLCDPAIVCNSNTGTCLAPQMPSGPCDETSDCVASVECGTDNLCGGTDALCIGNDDNLCDPSLVCNSNTGTCLAPQMTSGPCDETPDCVVSVECGSDNVCGGTDALCLVNDDNLCNAPLVCNSNTGTCLVPQLTSGPCDENADCAGSVECGSDNVCGGMDAACTLNDDNLCDLSLVCNSNTGTCLAPQMASGPCDENADCTAGIECGTDYVCGGTDASCPANNDNLCDPSLVCNSNIGTCLDLQLTGGPCDETADCAGSVECGTDNACGGMNAACTGNNDSLCDPSLVCNSNTGTCAAPQETSGPCDESADCSVNIGCSENACGGIGAACALDAYCINFCGVDGACGGLGAYCDANVECNSSLSCIVHTCSVRHDLGGICDEADSDDCLGTLECAPSVGIGVCGGSGASCGGNDANCLVGLGCGNGDLCGTDGAACSENSLCYLDRTCISGQCTAVATVGGTCDAGDPEDCAGSYDCGVDSTCGGLAADCSFNDDNKCDVGIPLVCNNEACAPLGQQSDSCVEDADCAATIGCGLGGACGSNGASCATNLDCDSSEDLTCVLLQCTARGDVGAACDPFDGDDCTGDLSCGSDIGSNIGLCGGTDALCLANNDTLCSTASSLVCIDSSCSERHHIGESCLEDGDCVPAVGCAPSSLCGELGASCQSNSNCNPANDLSCVFMQCVLLSNVLEPCDDSADCTGTLQCVGNMCLEPNGGACGSNTECINTCIGTLCADQSGTGGSCDSADTDDCAADLQCSASDTCLVAGGDACTSGNQCISGHCTSGLCYESYGAPCNGHTYFIVGPPDQAGSLTALQAQSIAESKTFPGGDTIGERNCYLAVLELEADQTCIENIISASSFSIPASGLWMAATDPSNSGSFEWQCPQPCSVDGMVFWQGGALGSSVDGHYQDWSSGQPAAQQCSQVASSNNEWIAVSCLATSGWMIVECENDPQGSGACLYNEDCTGSCINLSCEPLASLGDACDPGDSSDCALSMGLTVACAADGLCGSFGAPCTTSDACSSISCGTDFTCGGVGADCSPNNDTLCEAGSVCIGNSCSLKGELYGWCDIGDDSDCSQASATLECSSGVCLKPDGEGCSSNSECSNVCIGGSCAPVAPLGQPCDVGESMDCNNSTALACPFGVCQLINGETCSGINDDCVETCVNNNCVAFVANQGDCDDTLDCAVDEGIMVCNPGTNTCLFQDSEGCDANSQCQNVCVQGTCLPLAGLNQPCDETSDCVNGTGLVCFSEICLIDDQNACSDNADCVNTCISLMCAPPGELLDVCDNGPPDADDCSAPLECSMGQCLLPNSEPCNSNHECVNVCIDGHCSMESVLFGPCDAENEDCSPPLQCFGGICLKPTGIGCSGDNQECNETCIDNVCQNVQVIGGLCDALDGNDCVGNVDCGIDVQFGLGYCGGVGADCSINDDTLCNPVLQSDVCVFDQCGSVGSIDDGCQEDADCANTIGCATSSGLCGNRGASCISNSDCKIQDSLSCIFGTCETISTKGGACDDVQDCDGLDCSSSVCGGLNADCTPNNDTLCLDQYICYDTVCAFPKALGQLCYENLDCSSQSCVAAACSPILGVGFPCDDSEDCGPGVDCQGSICGGAGSACAPNDNSKCLSELTCIGDLCSALGSLSTPCEDDFDCISGRCIFGFCEAASQIGEQCDSNPDCSGQASCSPLSYLCGGELAVCTGNNDNLCDAPLVCIEGQCGALKANSDACAENGDCLSDACVVNFCTPPSAAGGVCDTFDSQDCVSPVQCADTTCGGIGAFCENDNDSNCASDLRCIRSTCAAPSGANGICDASNSDCAEPFVCLSDRCVNPSSVGGPCDVPDGNEDCESPLTCSAGGQCGGAGAYCGPSDDDKLCAFPFICVLDVCSHPKSNGNACDTNEDCVNVCIEGTCGDVSLPGYSCDETPDCSSGVSCSEADHTCGGLLAPCPGNDDALCDQSSSFVCLPGGLCGEPLPTSSSCDDNNDCEPSLSCISNQCALLSQLGGGCDNDDPDDCATNGVQCSPTGLCGGFQAECSNNDDNLCDADLLCIQSLCQALQDNGMGCGENDDCVSTVCIEGICTDPAGAGQQCDPNDESDCENEFTCGDASHPVCGGSGSICDSSVGTSEGDDALCDENLACVNGICRGPQPNLAACDSNADCQSGVCYNDHCRDPGALGDGCDVLDGNVDCGVPLQCGNDGVCGGDQAGCINDDNNLCFGGRSCIVGYCSTPVPNEAPCDGDNLECSSGHCIANVCAPASQVGSDCDLGDSTDCATVGCGSNGICGGVNAEGCGNNNDLCDTGLVCSFGTCSERVSNGNWCDSDNADCTSGHCIGSTCADASEVDGACDLGDASDCTSILDCGSNGICGGPGSVCTSNDNQLCSGNLLCIESSCLPPGELDASCGENNDCDGSLTCVAGLCGPLAPLNGVCDDGSDCSVENVSCSVSTQRCGGTGAVCINNDDNLCADSLLCVSGVCRTLASRFQACEENADCVSDVCINSVCSLPAPVGGNCDETADCAQSGVSCSSQEHVCGGQGASCSNNKDSFCESPLKCVVGSCNQPLSSGSQCQDDLDCASSVCVGLTCFDGPSNVGGQCDVGDHEDCDGVLQCGSDGVCGGSGAQCLENNDSMCSAPKVCVAGSCSLPKANGETCSEDGDCASNCILGICSNPRAVGGACEAGEDCLGALDCSNNGICGGLRSSCDNSGMCVDSMFCYLGRCRSPFSIGTPCEDNFYCVSSASCIHGFCFPRSSKGGICDVDDSADCVGDLDCGGDGTCGSVGATCVSDLNNLCKTGLVCAGGVCSEKVENGGVCEQDGDCVSVNCENGECTADTSVGDPCHSTEQCLGDVECSNNICGGDGAECSENEQCSGTCIDSECGPLGDIGQECEESEDCLGTQDCAEGVCGGDGGSCDSDEDCQKSCVEGTCGEEEVDQGEGLEENEIDLTEEEVEQLVEELSNLGSILADLANETPDTEEAAEKTKEAVALFSNIVAAVPVDSSEFFTRISSDAVVLTSNANLDQDSADSLSSSLESLSQSFVTSNNVQASVNSGAVSNILSSVASLMGTFSSSAIVIINSVESIEDITQSVSELLAESDEAFTFDTQAYTVVVQHPGGSFFKRSVLGDECLSVISREAAAQLIALYGRRGVALSQVDYRFNVYENITGVALDSQLQGIDLRFTSTGSQVDVSGGILVSIPISAELFAKLEDDEEPQCVFFDKETKTWKSDGMNFVRYGNNLDPRDTVKPRCIVCNTTHFTDFGALLTGGSGGGGASGKGNHGDGNVFEDSTFVAIFATSWALIIVVVVIGAATVVLGTKIKPLRDIITGKKSRERAMRTRRIQRESSQKKSLRDWNEFDSEYMDDEKMVV